jgi:hypothetical protein
MNFWIQWPLVFYNMAYSTLTCRDYLLKFIRILDGMCQIFTPGLSDNYVILDSILRITS